MPIREEVAREIAALYGFLQSISAACAQPPRSAAFTDSSERFFQYISNLSSHTLEYLTSYPVELNGTDDDFQDSRRELSTIRRAWRELHRFIKPAVDADTLNQPTALVEAMLKRLELIPGFEKTELAIFHTDEFNYFQISPALLARAVDGLAAIVGAEDLSKPTLIGIPNSQGSTLFLNSLVAHEVGHHAFGKKLVRALLVPEIEAAFGQILGDEYSKSNLPDRSTLIDLVAQWAEELFCDLFAVYLIGPCYSFAYIELYDVSAILDKRNHMAKGEMRPFYKFYPSDLFRVRQQAELLKALDWWRHVVVIESRNARTLEALLNLSDQDFIDAEKENERKLIVRVFLRIVPEISAHLGRIAGVLDAGAHQFGELWTTIAEYLDQGIVPSSINIRTGPSKYDVAHPSAITLLNASYRYYLERVEKLMISIKDQDPSLPEKKVYWIDRLQNWTSKALEDVALIGKSTHANYL